MDTLLAELSRLTVLLYFINWHEIKDLYLNQEIIYSISRRNLFKYCTCQPMLVQWERCHKFVGAVCILSKSRKLFGNSGPLTGREMIYIWFQEEGQEIINMISRRSLLEYSTRRPMPVQWDKLAEICSLSSLSQKASHTHNSCPVPVVYLLSARGPHTHLSCPLLIWRRSDLYPCKWRSDIYMGPDGFCA